MNIPETQGTLGTRHRRRGNQKRTCQRHKKPWKQDTEEGAIKNEHTRDTRNPGNKTQNERTIKNEHARDTRNPVNKTQKKGQSRMNIQQTQGTLETRHRKRDNPE